MPAWNGRSSPAGCISRSARGLWSSDALAHINGRSLHTSLQPWYNLVYSLLSTSDQRLDELTVFLGSSLAIAWVALLTAMSLFEDRHHLKKSTPLKLRINRLINSLKANANGDVFVG